MAESRINLGRLQKDIDSAQAGIVQMQRVAGKEFPEQYRTIGKELQAFRRWTEKAQAQKLVIAGSPLASTAGTTRRPTKVAAGKLTRGATSSGSRKKGMRETAVTA